MLVSSTMCLAAALYFEARGEPLDGQIAVANVIMNRVADSRFPDSVCGVITEDKAFSFVVDGEAPVPKDKAAWKRAVILAAAIEAAPDMLPVSIADHYHTIDVSPYWSRARCMERIGTVGKHIFYRWRDMLC